ncbi:MAG: hypothetical protein NVS2B16_36050 [Chloroflexota bacterium]
MQSPNGKLSRQWQRLSFFRSGKARRFAQGAVLVYLVTPLYGRGRRRDLNVGLKPFLQAT